MARKIKETLPGAEYAIHMTGSSDGARLFASRFDLLDHIKTLVKVDPVIAEVGVFHGHFSEKLLSVLKPTTLHLLDTFNTHDHISEKFSAFQHLNYVSKRFEEQIEEGQVVIHQGISWDELAKLDGCSLDYIYIDADHTYESVKKDIKASIPKMRPGSIIHFNDYTNAYGYGVLEAINEFLEESPNISLIGMSLDRSGYHDLAVQYLGEAANLKLTIVTPCSRPHNLTAMKRSIDFSKIDKWIIVHDTRTRALDTTTPMFPDNEKIVELECKDDGVVGHQIRNYALNNLVKEGWLYFLDDDNIVHPNFWTLQFKTFGVGVHTFDMQYFDGKDLKGDNPTVEHIDTAQFVFNVELVPEDARYDVTKYNADGHFIDRLVNEIGVKYEYHPIVAAWYNKLRQPRIL